MLGMAPRRVATLNGTTLSLPSLATLRWIAMYRYWTRVEDTPICLVSLGHPSLSSSTMTLLSRGIIGWGYVLPSSLWMIGIMPTGSASMSMELTMLKWRTISHLLFNKSVLGRNLRKDSIWILVIMAIPGMVPWFSLRHRHVPVQQHVVGCTAKLS